MKGKIKPSYFDKKITSTDIFKIAELLQLIKFYINQEVRKNLRREGNIGRLTEEGRRNY